MSEYEYASYQDTDPHEDDYDTAFDGHPQPATPLQKAILGVPPYAPCPTMLEEAMRAMTHAEVLRKRAKISDSTIFKTQAEEAMTWAAAYGQLAQAEFLKSIANDLSRIREALEQPHYDAAYPHHEQQVAMMRGTTSSQEGDL